MRDVKTAKLLKVCRIVSVGLLALLVAMPLIFRGNIVFATFATTVITIILIAIAFHVQRLRMLESAINKLDELLELLRDAKRGLLPREAKQLGHELEGIRAGLLRNASMHLERPPDGGPLQDKHRQRDGSGDARKHRNWLALHELVSHAPSQTAR